MNGISTPPETQVLEKFKKHKRRQVAQEKQYQRRCQQSLYFKELAFFLPFEKETMSQLDYSTLLQLTIAYLKMKHFTVDQKAIEDTSPRDKVESGDETTDVQCTASPETTACQASSKHLSTGFLSRMLRQTLDGFLMVVSTDGSILFVSDSVRRYLGYFETQLITRQIYDVIIDSDQEEVSKIMRECQMKAMSCKPGEKLDCSFFCRMKCQQKVSRSPCYSMGSGYKLVYVSGHFKVLHEESRLVAMVTPVSTPSIVEIAVEGNMFITHYTLDMRCSFYDGRLQDLLGFSKEEMLKGLVFDHHHHDDILMCQKCAEGVFEKGEGVSGYYRFVAKSGMYIWMQTRATLVCDSRTGRPQSLMCFNFIISKEEANKSTQLGQLTSASTSVTDISNLSSSLLSPASISASSDHSSTKGVTSSAGEDQHMFDPLPITTEEWKNRNPLNEAATPYSPPFSPTSDDVQSITTTVSTTSVSSGAPVVCEPLESVFSSSVVPNPLPDWDNFKTIVNIENQHPKINRTLSPFEQCLPDHCPGMNTSARNPHFVDYDLPVVSQQGGLYPSYCNPMDFNADSVLMNLLRS